MKGKIRPNFFIVGAPKCGTTAISEFLREHPNVFMSRPKEPHFFIEDELRVYFGRVKSLEEYLALFDHRTEKHLAVGEASVFYLYSPTAIKNIHRFNPNAKLIVLLRNPIEMAHASHAQALHIFNESERDFEMGWRLQESRRRGENIPSTCRVPDVLQYRDICMLGAQMERLFNVFPRSRVLAILYDDFYASPSAVYEKVLSFLCVPSDGRSQFPRVNQNRSYRFRWFDYLLRRCVRPLANNVRKMLGVQGTGVLKAMRKLNTRVEPRKPLDEELRKELCKVFGDDVQKLSKQLGRNLDHWLVPAADAKV